MNFLISIFDTRYSQTDDFQEELTNNNIAPLNTHLQNHLFSVSFKKNAAQKAAYYFYTLRSASNPIKSLFWSIIGCTSFLTNSSV